MKIVIDRAWKKDTYTISRLFIDGVRFCDALEDRDRGLQSSDAINTILSKKVYGETAIPRGEYEVTLSIVSPKYASVTWYNKLCGGKMPRLLNVPGFEGILIHPGNTALDTYGCILVGRNTVKGKLTQSRDTFERLYKLMLAAHNRGEKILITIK